MRCKKCGGLVEPSYEQIEECENCFADACGDITDAYKDKPRPSTISENEVLKLPIPDLGLSERTTDRLSDNDIIYTRDLVRNTETELKSMRGLGDIALVEIKRQLQLFGLALKKEKPSQLLSMRS